jgi:outer membrane protein
MKFLRIALAAFLISGSQWAMAAGATKVAVLDVQAVVLASEAGKSAMAELEKNAEYAALKVKLDNLEAEIKTLDGQAKNQGLTWGEDKKSEHRAKMTELVKERQGALNTLNRARETVFMQLLNAMEPGIGVALESVMAAEGIELVLDSKTAVLKVPTADVTPMVLDRLNKLNAQATENAKKAAAEKSGKKDKKN